MSDATCGARAFHTPDTPYRRARWSWLALIGLTGFGLLAATARLAASHAMLAPPAYAAHLATGLLPGVAAWLVWRRVDVALHRKHVALQWWGWAVVAQAAWPALAGLAPGALGGCLAFAAACGLTLAAIRSFWPLSHGAAAMLLPYIATTTLAGWPSAFS